MHNHVERELRSQRSSFTDASRLRNGSFIPLTEDANSRRNGNCPFASTTMSIATYRGIAYDTDVRKLNHLALIKRQLEKAQSKYDAAMVNARKAGAL